MSTPSLRGRGGENAEANSACIGSLGQGEEFLPGPIAKRRRAAGQQEESQQKTWGLKPKDGLPQQRKTLRVQNRDLRGSKQTCYPPSFITS